MAMIKCSECGKEISDKARKCPYCGKVFEEEKTVMNTKKCSECGTILSETDQTCPNCGCPVEEECAQTKEKPQEVQISSVKVGNHTKKILIGVIIALIVCAVGGIGFKIYSNQQEKKNYNAYIDNLEKAQELMISGGSDAETLCNLTAQVWSNAIYEKSNSETDKYTKKDGRFVSDFNTALGNLFADADTKSTVTGIEGNQEDVKQLMKKLQDVPDGLDKCYDSLVELNTAYGTLTDLAINPTGNYNSFTSNKSTAVSDFMSAYDKLDTQIPDKK